MWFVGRGRVADWSGERAPARRERGRGQQIFEEEEVEEVGGMSLSILLRVVGKGGEGCWWCLRCLICCMADLRYRSWKIMQV